MENIQNKEKENKLNLESEINNEGLKIIKKYLDNNFFEPSKISIWKESILNEFLDYLKQKQPNIKICLFCSILPKKTYSLKSKKFGGSKNDEKISIKYINKNYCCLIKGYSFVKKKNSAKENASKMKFELKNIIKDILSENLKNKTFEQFQEVEDILINAIDEKLKTILEKYNFGIMVTVSLKNNVINSGINIYSEDEKDIGFISEYENDNICSCAHIACFS